MLVGCQGAEEKNATRIRGLQREGDLEALKSLLDTDDADLRCRAEKAVVWTRSLALAETHAALLGGHPCDWRVQTEAAWRLFEEDAPNAVPALVAALADPAPEVRWNVARILGYLRAEPARAALGRCESDADKFVAAWCRWSVCKLDGRPDCHRPNMNLTNGKPAP